MAEGFGRLVAQRRIEQALMRMGLSFADSAGLIVVGEETEVGPDTIVIGEREADLDISTLIFLIRQLVLFRSMALEFGRQYPDKNLAKLTLQVCVNRLLLESWGAQFHNACRKLYTDEQRSTPLVLVDPSSLMVPAGLEQLWRDVWLPDKSGTYKPLNPASLYFRLARLVQKGELRGTTDEEQEGAPADMAPAAPQGRVRKLLKATARDVQQRLPKGHDLSRSLAEYSVVPMSVATDEVEDFLKKIRVRRIQDETAQKVLEPLAKQIITQPFPAYPSRLGLVYQMCGISDAFHRYWNRDVSNLGARLAIALYIDVSGSMVEYFSLIAGFARALREMPLRLRAFDTEVRDIDEDRFAEGDIEGGGGTDFDAPLTDLVNDRMVEAAVLFTDGEADVSAAVGKKLRKSNKRLFVVYIVEGTHPKPPRSPLNRYATDVITVPVNRR